MSSSSISPLFRCVLITGASSGLGLEFARQLAPQVDTLILVARRENLLEEIARDLVSRHPRLKVKTYASDLSTSADRIHLINALSQANIHPDCLLNNAGIGDYGEFRKADWSKTEQMIRLNMEALTHLTHALLPGIIAQSGAILNLSSLASILPIPDFAVYAATKAYVTSFSEALRLELREHDVKVLAVCPGPIKTGFGDVARRGVEIELPVKKSAYVAADKVVRDSIDALINDRPRLYPGLKIAAAATLIGVLPIAAVRLIMSFRPRRSD